MEAFRRLYQALDQTTATRGKLEALASYFRQAPAEDAAWALWLLCGHRLKRLAPTPLLRRWATELAGIPDWLFVECYSAVGDLAETIALLLPAPAEDPAPASDAGLAAYIATGYQALLPLEEAAKGAALQALWLRMPVQERFLYLKLITGGFRVGVSQQLVLQALASLSGLPATTLAQRMSGSWAPTAAFYTALLAPEAPADDPSRPYPFFLAYPLEEDPATLGEAQHWLAEWKWDGIRAQLIHRQGQVYLWSRGEELMTERFPELAALGLRLPEGTVLDGELLAWQPGAPQPMPFAELQKRITRKTLPRKLLQEVPVRLRAYDLLEHLGQDLRSQPLEARRAQLEALIAPLQDQRLDLSPRVAFVQWDELEALREQARSQAAEGLMLKLRSSAYGTGRRRGSWWKWKVRPMRADAVLVYAQQGHGRRAGLYTDYTFAIWREGQLVTFAKAYSGLDDAEIREVDAFIKANTRERFGPVRTVEPKLVFELGFEGIQLSPRHKSGLALRFPRILRWRRDKAPEQADSYDTLRALLPQRSG